HLQLNAGLGMDLHFMGATLDASSGNSWFGSAFVMLTGLGLFELTRRQFARDWGVIQEEIEKEIKRRESL
ncbi:MAG: branched-chain amino acid ABC transporter permease, partial [Betaproteobacteria bacterium]